LREYARQRPTLPADPGPSRFKRSFRISDNDARLLESVAGGDVSSFLRRVIVFYLASPGPVPDTSREPQASAPKPSSAVTKQRSVALKRSRTIDASFSQVEDYSLANSHLRTVLPTILSEPCEENGYSPLWRDGQWIRMPRTPEERRAWASFTESRQREEQRRRHAWEMSVGALCTCGMK